MNILTTSGYKNIEDCVVGEEIVAYEVGTGIEITNTIIKIEKIYPDFFGTGEIDEDGNPIYEPFTWYLVNGTYKMFKYQSIWTSPTTVKHAYQLEIGDEFYDDEDGDLVVTSIEDVEPDEFWWRLEISGDHSFIADGVTYHNASRYWLGTTSNSWGTTANWSSTSGGSGGSSLPSAADDVFFDSGGNNPCNTTTTARSCLTITFQSSYTSTFNFGGSLQLYSAAVFHPNTTYTGSGTPNLNTGLTSANKTITSNGVILPVTLSLATYGYTVTLNDDMRITLGLTVGNNNNVQTLNGNTLYVGGGCSVLRLLGTTTVIFNGSGTLISTVYFQNTLTINTSGTYTFSGTFIKYNNSLNYIAGTVITTGSILRITGSLTLDTYGILWNTIDYNFGAGNFTITINSLLESNSITFNFISSGTIIFAGTSYWETESFSLQSITVTRNVQLSISQNYLINSSFTDTISTSSAKLTLSSTTASSPAFLTLKQGATLDLGFTNFTDIDASGGQTIWVWKPTLSNTKNINTITYPKTISKTYIR